MVNKIGIIWAMAFVVACSKAYPSSTAETSDIISSKPEEPSIPNSDIISSKPEEPSIPNDQEIVEYPQQTDIEGAPQDVEDDAEGNQLAILQDILTPRGDDYKPDIKTYTALKRREVQKPKDASSDDDLTPPTREGATAAGTDDDSSDSGRCGGGFGGGSGLATQLLLATLLSNAVPAATDVTVQRANRPNTLAQVLGLLRGRGRSG